MVSVTVLVWRSDSGTVDISGLPAGQLVTVGAQLMMVWVRVLLTVRVVMLASGVGAPVTVVVPLLRGKCRCLPGVKAAAMAA